MTLTGVPAQFAGHCARCHATVTATLSLGSSGKAKVAPAAVIGCWCQCRPDGRRGAMGGPQAVPLTLRGGERA